MIGDGSGTIRVHFWGVRGSCPSPRNSSTVGGNTTCIELRCDGVPMVLDTGTGFRLLGDSWMPHILKHRRIEAVVLQSHLHLDHISGFPFFKPLFLPRKTFDVQLKLFGRSEGCSVSDGVQRIMSKPIFPVELAELRRSAARIEDVEIFDGFEETFLGTHKPVHVLARRVNHPDETYGYRVTCNGKTVAFTTDHEPYGGGGIPKGMIELVKDADLWITDCQYSHMQYLGEDDGTERFRWGHPFPEYLAEIARRAGPKRIVTMHHDPEADDVRVVALAWDLFYRCDVPCEPAYEGMKIAL
jgi:phosphoribosyl 1,2-cyclic phosphodiesterase